MDNSYYQNNLKFLYESADNNNKAVYNVDNLLYNYTSQDTFNNNVMPASFFTKVTGITLKREDPSDVSSRMNDNDSTNPTQLPTSLAFTDDSTSNEVKVDITRDTVTYTSVDLMEQIKERLDIVITKNKKNQDIISNAKGDVTKSNTVFDDYMRGIISAACLKCMWDAASHAYPVNDGTSSSETLDMAAMVVTTNVASNPAKLKQVFQHLSDTAKESLRLALAGMPQVRTDIMSNFNNTSTSFTRPLYYYLRTDMINKLNFPSTAIPAQEDDVSIYIKRILTDLYIKTCYPLLHYDFIDGMMRRYAVEGDYINVRIALLAKVFMTFYFVQYINKNVFAVDTTLTSERKNNYNDMFTRINTNINNYMTGLNNIDVNSTPGKNVLADIIRSVHDISNKVVQDSQDIDGVRLEIDQYQKGLRNIVANNEIMKHAFTVKVIEFWIMVSLLFTILIVCCVLLVLNMSQYVYYVTGVVIVGIIIMVVIRWIRSFFG